MRKVPNRDSRAVLRLPVAPNAEDVRCTLSCLERLLTRRRRLEELGLCGAQAPCHWHMRALDRAIVSYLVLAEDLGLERDAEALLEAYGRQAHSAVA